MSPHDYDPAENESDPVDSQRARRRLKIDLKDLGRYGFTKDCPKCSLHSQNRHREAHKEHHTEQCRSRIYEKMREAGAPNIVQAEQADRARTETRISPNKQRKTAPAPEDAPAAPSQEERLDLPEDASHQQDLPVDVGDPSAAEPLSAEAGIEA